jgi:5-formyltetrahydrofolate cyclo-ligase
MTASSRTSKKALRERVLLNRADLSAHDLAVGARTLRDDLLAAEELANVSKVAAYVSVGREPGTGPLIEALSERGVEVMLPIVRPDRDLDWARYEGPHSLAAAPRGLLEPTGVRLGRSAVLDADVVLVPALAVDRRGVRLGRGGGCYDRVLARLAGKAFSCALLHDGELLDMPVPREAHDVPVDAAATPSGVHRVIHSGPFG